MHLSPVRRTILKTMAFALTGAGLAQAQTVRAEGLMQPGSGHLQDLMRKLAAAPRRRDFKSVPMILTKPDEFDAEAIALVRACKAEPRQVWNNYDIAGFWTTVMRNSLNTQIFGFGHPEFLVVSATHGPAGLALLDQATWEKYQFGKFLAEKHGDKFKTNFYLADPPGDAHDVESPTGPFAMNSGDSIPVLQKRGVVFMACHNALWGFAEILIKRGINPDKLDHGALAAELTNHLIPGTILTPGVVGTLPELQRAGFVYANV